MDKEAVFEGKKYISAKRVSEKYGYNSDYIGQLCRTGSVDAKMVGRSWFVSEEAIANHKDGAARSPRGRLPKNLLSAKDAGALVGYSADYVGVLCRAGSIECRRVKDKWFVEESVLREYKNSAEKKLEESFKKRAEEMKNFKRPDFLRRLSSAHRFANRFSRGNFFSGNFLRHGRKIFVGAMAALMILFSGYFFINYRKANENFASDNVVREPLALSGAASQAKLSGMTVVPSSKDAEKDSVVKRFVKDSFSDEVEIVPDETGVSGLIKPIFKKENPQDYLFVMVPVKN